MWNTAERDTKTEMFQLIGFYLVVQGMLFQGVSQISSNMGRIGSCTEIFSLSVIISVLTSVAAIGGVYYKFLDLNALIIEHSNAETLRQVCHSIPFLQLIFIVLIDLYCTNLRFFFVS